MQGWKMLIKQVPKDTQEEFDYTPQICDALLESIQRLICEQEIPKYCILMELRATNRDLLDLVEKINRIREHFLKAYERQPLEIRKS